MSHNGQEPHFYEGLARLLASQQITASPAELHGIITGLVSSGLAMDGKSWLEPLYDLTNNGLAFSQPVKEALEPLYLELCQQLVGADFEFQLLLPAEDEALPDRIQALCDWAQGFLAGYGVQAGKAKVSAEVKEALDDLAEIANLSTDVEEDDDMAESAFIEVEEYLRVVAMLVFSNLGHRPKGNEHTLH
ncbi:UPF0149 family protein [Gallaecimonas kandeliae]|uniref:UPF0149 family protein n=1 Tax=Gallaecimonas kandeliae TaxID=3029055 RepID=UPI0026478C18|nr:UPF0149 family protein [Gallaecimonas kandeliae]WKE65117.1 UPF0149 family protein [Gallaecimonas kandeliae]